MINVSNEFKNVVSGQDRVFYGGAEITLADSTVLTLDNTRITGLKIEDATSSSGTFSVGSAVINKLTLSINNIDDAYSDYDFTDAVILPAVGLQLSETIETLSKGVFTADDPKVRSSVITLTALDNMAKFDKPFSGVTQSFPCTTQDLLDTLCTHCGVLLSTSTFFNDDYIIQSRPTDDAVNCREVVSWIAQIAGCFARVNNQGSLELKWYDTEIFEQDSIDGGTFDETEETNYQSGDDADGGNFTNYASGASFDGGNLADTSRYHHIYALSSFTASTDDVVITGVSVVDSSETPATVLFGSTGYVISLTGNKLIQSQSDANEVASTVGGKLVGMRFRPCNFTAISDPSREAGDIAYLTDRKQNTYQIFMSSVSFGIGQMDKISCDAESPSRNSAVRYDATTKAIIEARKNTETQLTAYDLLVQQMTNVIANGYGMFKTEVVDGSGGTIFYLHDKPIMSESTVRWFTTSEGTVEQVKSSGTWVTVSGTDKQGNALYNVLTARKISADIIRTGKIYSDDGATLIDMAYGVANSDNISMAENVQSGFPLVMKFYIDGKTSKISEVFLNYDQQNFRTYSTTAGSGGGSSITSESGGGSTTTASEFTGNFFTNSATQEVSAGNTELVTGTAIGTTLHSHVINGHSHVITSYSHNHNVTAVHTHNIYLPSHTHSVSIPSHTHLLNFGIQEQAISNNEITIYVDGTLRATTTDIQGVIDLSAHITTNGWHTIEIRSTTLKRVAARVIIKSYIRM